MEILKDICTFIGAGVVLVIAAILMLAVIGAIGIGIQEILLNREQKELCEKTNERKRVKTIPRAVSDATFGLCE